MGFRFSLIALGLVCVMACGCAHKKQPEPEANPMVIKFEKFRQTYDNSTYTAEGNEFSLEKELAEEQREYAESTRPIKGPDSGVTSIVLSRAHKSIGTPYVFGGTKPGGFDCSGFVQWAYKGAGIRLPRTAREQSQSGFRIRDKSQMRAGDIVAFRRRGGYHTGIYIGDGKFIHAPRKNKHVRIESMETGYFARNFIGARRVDTSGRSVELAASQQQQDKKYTGRKSKSRKNVANANKVKSRKAVTSSSKKQNKKSAARQSSAKKKSSASASKSSKSAKASKSAKSGSKTAASGQGKSAKKAATQKSGKNGKAASSSRQTVSRSDGKNTQKKSGTVAQNQKKKNAQTARQQDNKRIEVRVSKKNSGSKSAASNEKAKKERKG